MERNEEAKPVLFGPRGAPVSTQMLKEEASREAVMIDGQVVYEAAGEDGRVRPDELIQMAESWLRNYAALRAHAIAVTTWKDWTAIGAKGKEEPYLGHSGADRILRLFRLSLFMDDGYPKRHNEEDKGGPYFWFEVRGRCGIRRRDGSEETIPVIGAASSRNKFFSKKNGVPIPFEDIDIVNIEKMAETNFRCRGVKNYLGLDKATWEELRAVGIDVDKIQKVEFGSEGKPKQTTTWDEGTKAKAKAIGSYLLACTNNNKDAAEAGLMKWSSFRTKEKTEDGKTIPGKQIEGKKHLNDLSAAQVGFIYREHQEEIETFNRQTQKAGQEAGKGTK